jgi:hypothetical protein
MVATERLTPPEAPPPRDFGDVLRSRRSAVAGAVDWGEVAALLWHAAGTKGHAPAGRAGLPVEWRASPSAGGLHPIHLVCINDGGDGQVRLYDPMEHAFHVLAVPHVDVSARNAAAVAEVVGVHRGCTLRFIADVSKVGAAYESPASLVLRDAGCLVATLCLCAEWLDLAACPLGFLGHDMVGSLGFPEPRFQAVGAVQVSRD